MGTKRSDLDLKNGVLCDTCSEGSLSAVKAAYARWPGLFALPSFIKVYFCLHCCINAGVPAPNQSLRAKYTNTKLQTVRLRMGWSGILPLSWDMRIQKYINVKINDTALDLCATAYKAYGNGKVDSPLCDNPGFENTQMKLLRHVSLVDFPGHNILMATIWSRYYGWGITPYFCQ